MPKINSKGLIALQSKNTGKLVTSALFAAFVTVSTIILVIPLPGSGFANLGDCMVIMAGCLLGPIWGAAAAAIGASLADMSLGYMVYMPATFVIKGIMAALAFYVLKITEKMLPANKFLSISLSALAAESVMVMGYFIFECFLLGRNVAIADIPGNAIQGAVGIVTSVILLRVILSNDRLKAIFSKD